MLLLVSTAVFAQNDDDNSSQNDNQSENQDTPEIQTPEETKKLNYKMNGAGDQYLKISIMPSFPWNFGNQMYTGGAVELGYHRFLTSWLAIGGDAMAGYQPTIGSNIFTYIPITFGPTFQPTVWKFEFPITLGVGAALETCGNRKYFPGLVIKPEVGAYFRYSESWSFGLGCDFMYMPQWYKDNPEYNDYGLFITAAITARYHF